MIEFKKMLVTPTLAKQMLEANTSNRRLRENVVMQYANDMISDRWKENTAEMIKVSETGVILDGQHRLHGVIKANKPIYFYIATNLPDEVFDVLDTGSRRNASDVFMVQGIKNQNLIPSMISMYNLLVLGKRYGIGKHDKATNAMLLEQYYKEETFWQNVARQSGNWYMAFAKILPTSYIGGFYAYFHKLNNEKAEEFFKQLTTGIDVENNTILLLRNKLMQDKMSPRKMPQTLKMALIIKTWNYYIKGQEPKLLKYDTVNEEFPVALSF